jgi:hypothetical protein
MYIKIIIIILLVMHACRQEYVLTMERWQWHGGRKGNTPAQADGLKIAWPPVKLASFIIDCPLRASSLCLSTFFCACAGIKCEGRKEGVKAGTWGGRYLSLDKRAKSEDDAPLVPQHGW